jgi:hypothetical protein
LESIKRDKGGVNQQTAMRRLVLRIAVIWFRQFPKDAGITKCGERKSRERYKGPLLDFAAAVLPPLGVPFASHDSIGRLLWSIKSRAKELAAVPVPAEPEVPVTPLSDILAAAHKEVAGPTN